jgi:4'-phosphopantetheinyl transferase
MRPELAPDSLHVWRADLRALDDHVLTCVSASERRRAAGFPRAHAGLLWGRSRGVLRELLASYLDIDSAEVRLARAHRGKPIVEHTASGGLISFSVSHSGALALYAFARREVGVDVQLPPRREANYVAIASRAFGAEAGRHLGRLPERAREREFLRAWAMHEARLKCRGVGLGVSERDRAYLGGDRAQQEPWACALATGASAAAAVACASPPRELSCFDWAAAARVGAAG